MCARSASLERAIDAGLIASSALPLAYYFVAYAGFGAGLAVLAADPSIAGASFYQPRFIALVHLLTLAWLTGSILGSLYIVAPLALRVPMRVRTADWAAFGAFVFGMSGMIAHFWINTYDGMAWSAVFVTAAIVFVGGRLMRGMRGVNITPGVRLHIVLAFFNILAAAILGMIIGFDRSRGFLSIAPLHVMFAHIHLAAVGWVAMLVVGLSYRLIPMMLPAPIPTGRPVAVSATLIESGLVLLTASLLVGTQLWPATLLIACGLISFIAHVRAMVGRRLPRPPALPLRDWSTWQVHAAFGWLIVAVATGAVLSVQDLSGDRLRLMWIYGTAGLVGFLAQMVTGVQGRLVPLYAWYRAYAATGAPPECPANALPSSGYARAIFLCWAAGVPLLVWGLSGEAPRMIRAGAASLFAGVILGAAYGMAMLRRATTTSPRNFPHVVARDRQIRPNPDGMTNALTAVGGSCASSSRS